MKITESDIEQLAIELLTNQGYHFFYGPDIAPESDNPQRHRFDEVLLNDTLQTAIARLNPSLPTAAQDDAFNKIQRIDSTELIVNNETFHRFLTEGIPVNYQQNGHDRGELIWLVDFENPANNEFTVVNQFTVLENHLNKRPDLILFINGLPLVVIELKNPTDEKATLQSAYQQLRTYQAMIPSLFTYNGILIIADGLEARAGTLSANISRFMAWKSADGQTEASPFVNQLETLIKGMLNKATLLDLMRHFIVFEKSN